MAEQNPLSHKLTLSQGEKLTVTGVSQIKQFEPQSAVMETPLGDLLVQGQQLQLKTLTPEDGQVVITGQITDLGYLRRKPEKSFWGRLLG